MAFELGCKWHSGCKLWHFETSRWLWGTVVRQCKSLLSKHERLVTPAQSKLMMIMIKEVMNWIRVSVIVMLFLWKNNRHYDRNWKIWHHAVKHWSVVVLWCWPYLPNGHPACPWLATRQEAWAFAMFCWHCGKLVMMVVSDSRRLVQKQPWERQPRRYSETNNCTYRI